MARKNNKNMTSNGGTFVPLILKFLFRFGQWYCTVPSSAIVTATFINVLLPQEGQNKRSISLVSLKNKDIYNRFNLSLIFFADFNTFY